MRIVLISRIDDDEALAFTASLAQHLKELGHTVLFEAGTGRLLGERGVPFEEFDADLAVVVGGDGSVLLTVHRMRRQIPILGINWGEVGFLASLEPEEAEAFFATLTDGFPVERRMRITLSMQGEELGTALNEAVIVTERPAKMLRFSVAVDGKTAERFRADGILISTPTGSTAYAMSAGGPIIDPRINGFLVIPLAPYMLSSRPHLISSDRTLDIQLETEKPAHLVVDGQSTYELDKNTVISVRMADVPACFVRIGKPFFERVEQKLRRL
ncbi:NAD(+) kinase [Methanoculleus sp. FWC-SCC1]|uniref:NAD kinase n=1 Tax=Methanoculleus frigidifontis TaxID=2584085 RepID=A0ABT8M614_9EURY|nr:NAD(+)/NADH kinase [Methanoculleus sp. FWC-SCC1]MDN7023373.1 NAD(+) kinase [Methanoculleus sp. FWC-SCC1]